MPVGVNVKRIALWLLMTVMLAGFGSETSADPFSTVADRNDPERHAINSGIEIERSRDWLKAIEFYEQAVDNFPANSELKYGLRRAKIHFGVDRRYNDTSFRQQLMSLPLEAALNRFDELLTKIQDQYVDPLSSTSFVAHGTESLYLALANEQFTTEHLRNADPNRIRELRRVLREEYWNLPVQNRAHARQVVRSVCDKAYALVQLAPGAVVMEYIFGGCNALDDYSNYLTPERLSDLYNNIEGEFVGLGIEMKSEMGQGLLLVNVLSGSPAEEGKMYAGDHITGVDGLDCRYMTTDEAADLLRGPRNSKVTIEYKQSDNGELKTVVLLRRPVQIQSVPEARIVDRAHGIGYIRMTGFQKTTASELDAALAQLNREGMRALIWDVRGNPGGLLTTAVEVLDRFISEGTLVSTRGRTADQNWSYSAHRPGTWSIPLVLLVDGDSASASEIVAGAIEDHHRGTLVGRKTFGKWSVQSIFPIHGSTGMRLTTAKFYSPNGGTYSHIGIQPDIVVPEGSRQRTMSRGVTIEDADAQDLDLLKGIEILRRDMAG